MKISVDFDSEKLEAVKFSLEKSGQSVEQELVLCLQKLYEKSVPKELRAFIERMKSPADTEKAAQKPKK